MGAEAIGQTETSFGLRSDSATLMDVAAAYGVLAAQGVRYGQPGPSTLLRVESLDHAVWLDLSEPQAQPVLSAPLAYLMNNVLSDDGAREPTLGHPNPLELDRQLVSLLKKEFADSGTIEVVQADILRTDLQAVLLERWPGKWAVAANLPYNISSQVLIRFMENRQLFSRLVLMLQKEVGDRLVARPGTKEYGVLSVLLRLHFDIVREFAVKPGSFHPVPKVDSVVLTFIPLPAARVEVGDERFFRQVVKAVFGQRRKTLWNALKSLDLDAEDRELSQVLAECGIDSRRRGETLSLDEFALLSRALVGMKRGNAG